MAELTSFQWALIFVLIIAVILIAAIFLFWIARKYPSKKTTKADPFIKVIIIISLLLLIHVGLIAFGILDRESLKNNIKYYMIGGIVLLLWYAVILPYFWKRPIPTEKLFRRYVMPDIRRLYGGTIYVGDAYLDNFLWSMVIPAEFSAEMKENGILNELVECFLVQVKSSNAFWVFAIRDKFTGEGLRLHKNPPISLLNSYLGKDVTKSMEEKLKEGSVEPESAEAT